jgi:aspartyl-tRNA(Asn)/glutamyl-tRNA(Gln) amidotransferase subunit B
MSDWETVIGLEIHAQLATRSKIFSGSATAYGAPPNTQANLVDLAYPGVLPVLNAEAVRMAVKFGLSIGAEVTRRSVFARKNYFIPIAEGLSDQPVRAAGRQAGALAIMLDDGSVKTIGVTRAHLEEDAGKSLHEGLAGRQRHRFEPCRHAAARDRLRARYALGQGGGGVHEEDPHLGALSRDLRRQHAGGLVSLRRQRIGASARGEKFGTRAEIKNLNSFRFVEKAIQYEVARQIELLESGGKVVQETRLYDSDKDETRSMRSKEEANDYRYFPDPDLLPVQIDESFIEAVRHAAGAAGRQGGALRARLRLVGLRCGRAERKPRAGRVLRGGGGALGRRMPSWRRIGSWANCRARLNRDNVEIGASRVLPEGAERPAGAHRGCRRSRARSPRRYSRACGRTASRRTPSSRPRG